MGGTNVDQYHPSSPFSYPSSDDVALTSHWMPEKAIRQIVEVLYGTSDATPNPPPIISSELRTDE